MKRIAVVMCSLVLLSACSGGDDSASEGSSPSTSAQSGATAQAVSKDPLAVCEALFDGEADSPMGRLAALDGVVVDEAGLTEVNDIRQELVAAIAKSPTDLAANIEALRAPLGDVISQVSSGTADVMVDSAAVATATTDLTATCDEAGYTVPAA
ncbi:hypothetical protein Sked_00300 [Sanguibacter keddieii DSM 10542]|uniref:Lipoprotein n=1 Tax=Sanguibacter keddieii (strain ATCC 51767 / DSM 10542 / NCFB 3025 / ST-74) TaxID=446469 RepID=D1BI32_SANKS|nr:hypothetical protein Sked_00300 [Sanguibacter keddieii DSM 10542]